MYPNTPSQVAFDLFSPPSGTNKGIGFFISSLLGGFIGFFSIFDSRDRRTKYVAVVAFIGINIFTAATLGKCHLDNVSELIWMWRPVNQAIALNSNSRPADRRISNRCKYCRLHPFRLSSNSRRVARWCSLQFRHRKKLFILWKPHWRARMSRVDDR